MTNLNYNAILNPPAIISYNTPATFLSTLNISGNTTLNNKTIIKGILNIHNGSPYATSNFTLNNGSLIIGDTLLNYGGGTQWNGGNAAGLLMECDNNTEIVVHDNAKRLASLMYYEGDNTNKITIGRNMGWTAISSVTINGNIDAVGSVNIKSDNQVLDFGGRGLDNLIKLWSSGTDTYGFGINGGVLRYNVPASANHRFYTGATNTFTIDGSGNAISSGYMYAGGLTSGLRINGNDYGNTIYQDAVTIAGNQLILVLL